MSSIVEEHVIYQLANAPMREYPYPHIYVDSIFPPDFYATLRQSWPSAANLVNLGTTGRVPEGAYPERFIMPLSPESIQDLPEEKRAFWAELQAWLLQGLFLQAVLQKFEPYARQRFGSTLADVGFAPEVLVVRDHTNYNLGPHTDNTQKVLSLLFYCPDDESLKHLGTSIYTPLDRSFRCPGGPHYPHERFRKVATMQYRPNTLFAFFKTDNSFHGVEPIRESAVLRDLMLYDIRVAAEPDKERVDEANAGSSTAGATLKRLLGFQA